MKISLLKTPVFEKSQWWNVLRPNQIDYLVDGWMDGRSTCITSSSRLVRLQWPTWETTLYSRSIFFYFKPSSWWTKANLTETSKWSPTRDHCDITVSRWSLWYQPVWITIAIWFKSRVLMNNMAKWLNPDLSKAFDSVMTFYLRSSKIMVFGALYMIVLRVT